MILDMDAWSTAALTVLGGVTVFVVGQFVLKWIIEPLQEYKELKGEISYALLYHANVSANSAPREEVVETRKHLRGLAGRLRKTHAKIPFYGLCSAFRLVPVQADLFKASDELVGWSNGLRHDDDKSQRRRTIADCLGIAEVY